MDRLLGASEIDDRGVRFRVASVRVALGYTLLLAAGAEIYLLATWDQPHRPTMTVITAVGIVSVFAVQLLPTERIIRSRWRELFFTTWSGVLIVLIAVAVAVDGGVGSPLTALFVLPVIFAALSYPPIPVLVVGAIDIVAFGAVALFEPGGTPQNLFITFVLLCAGLMCATQARNRRIQEEQLGAITGALEHSEEVSRQRAVQQQEVAAFGQRALAGAPIDQLMEDAVSTLKRVLAVDMAGVLEVEEGEEGLRLRTGAGIPDRLMGTATVSGGRDSQSGYTLDSDAPVIVDDWATETRFTKSDVLERLGVLSGATVVIKVAGRPFGVLGTQSVKPHRFGPDEVNFLQGIANALASAIERRQEEEDAHHRALHDPLTGLPNRALFEDRLERALAQQERREQAVAVIFLDVDRFKLVNDSLGHHTGDELLKSVAPRLKQALRPGDTVARFGGDEFGILIEDVSNERDATRVAERISATLAKPFVVGGREHFVTASLGIAVGGAAQLPATLIRDADAAMYRAKERGRARYEIFDEAMRVRIANRLTVENELRSAIDRDELRVHYQPVISLSDATITGAEALVRWQHPKRGLLPPLDFIPIAEESGLITQVGRWVLEEACRQTAAWHEANPDQAPVGISVNMSVRQLGDRELTPLVERVLERTGLDPVCLSLELTEGALIEETESVFVALNELRGLGIRLVLDDFGTGYSSLRSLQRLPFDAIKLDRTFVERLGGEGVDTAIVSAVVSMAQTLELNVVAEGVETEEQLEIVKRLGCHHAQGFYYSPAVTAERFGRMLDAGESLMGTSV